MPELSGVTVVVTRPAHQAENLCQQIAAAGGKALRFPVIEIRPAENPHQCLAQLARLAEYDLAFFVSVNAVTATLAMLKSAQAWPVSLPIAAVGKATAKAVTDQGLKISLTAPEPYNSEALLGLPELQNLDGKRMVIFRGNEGREFLRDSLVARGAEVDYVECYQRGVPQTDTRQLYAAWEQNRKMVFVVTSNQGLQNLVTMVNNEHQPELLASPLVLISKRSAKLAQQLGFTQTPQVAEAANDKAILNSLLKWARP
jgi:uroporphyrinogen-III synthase